MPFAPKPTCGSCGGSASALWRKFEEGRVVCNACHLKANDGTDKSSNGECGLKSGGKDVGSQFVGPIRKSARLKPSKYKHQPVIKPLATKGKSRRVIFKKNPIKAPGSVATMVTSQYLFYDGTYWQVGDLASVMDDDGGIYYVQMRGFLQDQYCNKSAVITWLLPTTASRRDGFDPATYILGPEEDLPRNMDCFEFLMHAPSDYFKSSLAPYPTKRLHPEMGYVWTSMGPEIRPVPSREELYGLRDLDSCDRGPVITGREKSKDKKDGRRKEKTKEDKEKKEKDAKEKPSNSEREANLKKPKTN